MNTPHYSLKGNNVKSLVFWLSAHIFSLTVFGASLMDEKDVTLKNFLWTKFPVEYSEISTDKNAQKIESQGIGKLYLNFEKAVIEIYGLRASSQYAGKYNILHYDLKISGSIKIDSMRYAFECASEKFAMKATGFVEFEPLNSKVGYYKVRSFEINFDKKISIRKLKSKYAFDLLEKFKNINFTDDSTLNNSGEIVKDNILE